MYESLTFIHSFLKFISNKGTYNKINFPVKNLDLLCMYFSKITKNGQLTMLILSIYISVKSTSHLCKIVQLQNSAAEKYFTLLAPNYFDDITPEMWSKKDQKMCNFVWVIRSYLIFDKITIYDIYGVIHKPRGQNFGHFWLPLRDHFC